MRKSNRILVGFVATALLAGCGTYVPVTTTQQVPQMYSLDYVKLLSSGVTEGGDPSTYLQQTYTVSPVQHLLLRYKDSSLQDHVDRISLLNGNTVSIQITVPSADAAVTAKEALSLCPVLRNWMRLATWDSAYPFGEEGRWQQPGGDYSFHDCVQATKVSGADLQFDVTTWFTNYPRGRHENYGLMLVAARPVTVLGEQSGTSSPRILWTEEQTSTNYTWVPPSSGGGSSH